MELALIGCGRWAMLIYSFLRSVEGVSVSAVYDQNPATRGFFCDLFELPAADTLEAILDNDSIKGVLILTANSSHYPLAMQCLKAGKDVFIEKPITASLDEARKIFLAAKNKGRILMVGHNSRRHPAVRRMKRLIDDEAVGEIKTVEATFSYSNMDEILSDTWRNCSRSCPGGPLLQLGVHHADNLPYLFGPVERVSGEIMPCPDGSNVPAGGRLLLRFSSGIIGSITADYTTAPEIFSIFARGTTGEIRVEGENRLTVIDADGKATTEEVEGFHSLHDQLAEFCRCIEKREKPETDGQTGLDALNIILTGLRAAELHQALPVGKPLPDVY